MSSTQLTKNDITRLLPINDLLYTRTAPTNPVVERTQKKSYAEGGAGTSYSGLDHMVVNLQTGTEFIDPLQSFLVFEYKVFTDSSATADLTLTFQGSAMNLIRDTHVATRSGKEMDRLEQANLLAYHKMASETPDYLTHNLEALMQNHGVSTLTSSSDRSKITIATGATESGWQKVMIPLKYISPIFDSEKLMPSHLARGLKIDCTLENFNTAFTEWSSEPEASSYQVRKAFILADSYRMSDAVLSYINAEFASKDTGLVYEYSSYHTTKTTTVDNDLSVEVRRSVSLALDLMVSTRLSSLQNDLEADSFASCAIDNGDRVQFRIGSHRLPNTPSEGIVELYAQYLYWANMLRDSETSGVRYDEFLGNETASTAVLKNKGLGAMCCTLQRNAILDLSGIAINNSMTLAIEATLGVSKPRQVSMFLRHLRRAVLFLESTILET